MICLSMDPLIDFTIYGIQVCHVLMPYLELHNDFILSKEVQKSNTAPVRKLYTLSDSRGSFEEHDIGFKKNLKENLQMNC